MGEGLGFFSPLPLLFLSIYNFTMYEFEHINFTMYDFWAYTILQYIISEHIKF